ncbi:MAG: PDZ domain-containing protein [Aeromicrobium erythreum]
MDERQAPDPAAQLSRRYGTLVAAGLTLVALVSVAFILPVPYVTMRPGPVFNTLGDFEGKPMFTFGKDARTYPTEGALDFTTVSVTRADTRVTLVDVLKAYLVEDDVAVVPHDIVYPDDQSEKDSAAVGQAQLTSSKDSSRVAALRAAGYRVPEQAAVAAVTKGAPADGRLQLGDRITSVDGRDTTTAASVVKLVSGTKPGQVVRIGYERRGRTGVASIRTRADARDPKVARVGVSLRSQYAFPVKISNNVGDQVGGPSAGMMFALAIYDRLTPGPLTGGLQVAGTGEIAADGTVGPIGGIRQKLAGAAAADAQVFLAPAANCGEVRAADRHGMRVVKVSTLKDAIRDLRALAKDPKASVPTC